MSSEAIRAGGTTRRRTTATMVAVAAVLIGIGGELAGDTPQGSRRHGATRGILTEQSVDLPLDPDGAELPRPTSPIARVRIGVRNADPSASSAAGRVAPIDLVAPDAQPDLVWDAATGELRERDEIVALGVKMADLPAAADRLALSRRLRDLVQQGRQAVRLVPDGRSFRIGTDIEVTLPKTAGRSVAAMAVAGDGTVNLLWPQRGDPAVADTDVRISLAASDPIGVDQLVVVSSEHGLESLVTASRRLDRRRAAGDLLGLIDRAAGSGVLVGLQSIATQR